MIGKVLLGSPELARLAKGEKITVRVQPGTSVLEISLSMIAKGELTKAKDPVAEMLSKMGIV